MKVAPLVVGIGGSLIAIAGLSLSLPNLMWLKHSTLRVNNTGKQPLEMAQLSVGETTLEIQDIEPGEFEFRLLPKQVNGTMAITLPPSRSLESLCHTYSEGKMFHIEVQIQDGKVVACQSSVPFLSKLWVVKAFL